MAHGSWLLAEGYAQDKYKRSLLRLAHGGACGACGARRELRLQVTVGAEGGDGAWLSRIYTPPAPPPPIEARLPSPEKERGE